MRQNLGMSLGQWYSMTPRERAFEVAVKRVAQQASLLQNAELQDYAKRQARRRR